MQRSSGFLCQFSKCHATVATLSRRCFGQPAAQTHPHLVQEGEVTPGLTKEEYSQRRHRLLQLIDRHQAKFRAETRSDHHIVVIPSAAKAYMTHDIPYIFRQNTDFLYLCGFLEPNSVLVLEAQSDSLPTHKSTLFVPKKDPHRELWDGARSGIAGAVHLTGVDAAVNVDDMKSYLDKCVRDHHGACLWYDNRKPAHMDYHLNVFSEILRTARLRNTHNPRSLLQALRMIKSPAEQKLMQKSCQIASQSFIEVMKYSHPEVNESHLFACMDFECRVRGADYLAYPPVVAGGDRANTIHYISNNQLIPGGKLVLMDAGCECHGYTSDITRTWPVSGEFSPPQLELYEALLEIQEYCLELCVHGDITMETIFTQMLYALGKQLQSLGIISPGLKGPELQRLVREFCPHHVSHYLGMDVHDTDEIPRTTKLLPGMCITIEPGLYIPETRRDVPAEFRGTGLRIEDDVLITEGAPVNLSASCPKSPQEIQAVMAAR